MIYASQYVWRLDRDGEPSHFDYKEEIMTDGEHLFIMGQL